MTLEDKLPCAKMIPTANDGIYACACGGEYGCNGTCPQGARIDVPEGTMVKRPGYEFHVKEMPRCDKYSKPNGNGGST